MVQQPTGYRAFIPAPLPPDPPFQFDTELMRLLSEADRAVGRLDGATQFIPNPSLFVAMYVRREAVLSSQIEGTQSSLDDILAFELNPNQSGLPHDVDEVVNYVQAMNYGLQRLDTLPLSLRLLREIHGILLDTGRGAEKHPGEFRTSQNWIGPANVPLSRATFVPPPPYEMRNSLDNLERFLHDQELPVLIHAAVAHAQFETIHPFLDGNGRVGRLLITLLLCHREVLEFPLLYLSYYLKLHRAEYYDRLGAIRLRGDWEGWLRFFLQGVIETAEEASRTARNIIQLRNQHLLLIQERGLALNGLRLLELLFATPFVNSRLVVDRLDVVPNTANRLLDSFEELGILEETTGQKRSRIYRYKPYLALFNDPVLDAGADVRVESTETNDTQNETTRTSGERWHWRDLEIAYLSSNDPRAQSGFRGDAARWEAARRPIAAAIHRNGTFLDIGCANGLLMETITEWAAEDGYRIEPYGLDIAPRIVELARTRLPQWADRIFVGDAMTWQPPQRFDFVRTELIYAAEGREREYVERLFADLVAPGGRLIVCSYGSSHRTAPRVEPIDDWLRDWGFHVGGTSEGADPENGIIITRVAWVEPSGR